MSLVTDPESYTWAKILDVIKSHNSVDLWTNLKHEGADESMYDDIKNFLDHVVWWNLFYT